MNEKYKILICIGKCWILIIVLFACVLFVVLTVTHTSSFEACVEAQTDENFAQHYYTSLFPNTASAHVQCWGQFTYAYRDAITTIATIFLAIFTGTLWQSTKRQAELTRESIDLGNKEFVASHRPKLIVRRVSLDEGTPPTAPIGRQWKIQYIVANIGGSNATIVDGNASVKEIEGELPAIPEFDPKGDIHPGIFLTPGQSMPLTVPLENNFVNRISFLKSADGRTGDPRGEIHFFGYLQYKDAIGVVRRTAFCRRYNVQSKRFTPVKDHDYEYRD